MKNNKSFEDLAPLGAQTLRTVFCDAPAGSLPDQAQEAANRECKYPRQTKPQAHEPFEPHGMN